MGIKEVRATCGHHNRSVYSPNHEIGGGEDLRYMLYIAIIRDEKKIWKYNNRREIQGRSIDYIKE